LFEDIDNLDAACGRVRESGISFVGNKAEMNKRVTLDGLLNALDGVHRGTQKRILVATTNYPEKLIPSIRRRGRFGHSVRIDYPDDAQLEDMFKYYLPQVPKDEVLANIRGIEQSLGLRLSTAAAIDIIAKLSLQRSPLPPSDLGHGIVKQVEDALRELESSNQKQLRGTHELLSLLGLQEYADCFLEQGLVDMRYVKLLNDGELKELGIQNLGDRKKLLDSFQYMEDTPVLFGEKLEKACKELRMMRDQDDKVVVFNGVPALLRTVFKEEQAFEREAKFKEEGLGNCTIEELQKLTTDDLQTKLGLAKLGDRQRLLLCIERLREA
jgi:SpoVK/Ycf46/Vps4 family AAA+-type ATPase